MMVSTTVISNQKRFDRRMISYVSHLVDGDTLLRGYKATAFPPDPVRVHKFKARIVVRGDKILPVLGLL